MTALVHVITDIFGPIAYSRDPSLILTKYLQALQVGGKIFIAWPNFGRSGEGISFVEFLARAQGINFKTISPLGVLIEKASDNFSIPKVHVTIHELQKPPLRSFYWADDAK